MSKTNIVLSKYDLIDSHPLGGWLLITETNDSNRSVTLSDGKIISYPYNTLISEVIPRSFFKDNDINPHKLTKAEWVLVKLTFG